MHIYWIYIFLVFTVVHQSKTLRCRSGNGKLDKNIQKAMMKCKHQEMNDSSSIEDSFSDENISSDSSIFDEEFFSFNKKNQTNSNTLASRNLGHKNSNNDCNKQSHNCRGNQRFHHIQNGNYFKNIGIRLRNNYNDKNQKNKDNNDNNTKQSPTRRIQNINSQRTDHDNNQKSCFFQCLLNELNAVNQQGYPERIAVTNLMLKGVYDPAVRDLVEEFIIECFHFLQTQMIDDKCTFSQHLFKCFDNKGRERCDDWNI